MMTLMKILSARRSVRNYLPKEVEPAKLDYVLEAARLAPSACNRQPWLFFVVREREKKEKLQACYARDWFKSAPVYIVACADHTQSWKRAADKKDHADIDVSIAVEHICLAAVEQKLGTCWVCNFDEGLVRNLFDLPEHIEPVAIIPIGYPDNSLTGEPTSRKNIFDIVKWE